MWFVALQPCQGQPCDCFEHLLVITLSTWAKPLRKKNGAHAVKRGIRIMHCCWGYHQSLFTSFSAFHVFSPTAQANGVFSPDKLRCVPVRVAGAGSGGEFRKVPESSGVCWCRFWKQVPEGSGGFRCRSY